MPITLNLRQAVIHKIHGQDEAGLRDMIEGSIDGPETALPGLGTVFEMIWKDTDPSGQEKLVTVLHKHLESIRPGSLTTEQ